MGQIHFAVSGTFVAMDPSPVSVRCAAGTIDRFFCSDSVVERSESGQRFDHGSGHVGSHGRPVQKWFVLIFNQLFVAVFRGEIRQRISGTGCHGDHRSAGRIDHHNGTDQIFQKIFCDLLGGQIQGQVNIFPGGSGHIPFQHIAHESHTVDHDQFAAGLSQQSRIANFFQTGDPDHIRQIIVEFATVLRRLRVLLPGIADQVDRQRIIGIDPYGRLNDFQPVDARGKFPELQQFFRGEITEQRHGDRRIMVHVLFHPFGGKRVFPADTFGHPFTFRQNVGNRAPPVFLTHFGKMQMHIPGCTVRRKFLTI